MIADTMNAKVRATRAYSSLDDPTENEAKERTRFPVRNFENVINSELMNAPTDILLVQSGSVDITNLKTTDENLKKYGEYFKQHAIMSATNLFTTITNALKSSPNLQKVILMKHIPRYDPTSCDPQSIKAALSKLYNDTIVQLWLFSPLKNRISIGSHNLECTGGVRDSRYRYRNRNDGIHLNGPSGRKAYTESVLCIIRSAGHVKSPPPMYFHRYHKSKEQTNLPTQDEVTCPTQDTDYLRDKDIRYTHNTNYAFQYAVPTSNRFNSFNQGNC